MRAIEVSVEQRRNERAGETGDYLEDPPTNDIVRHDFHMRKSGADEGEMRRERSSAGIRGQGETGDPRGNSPTSGIVRHDCHLGKYGRPRPKIILLHTKILRFVKSAVFESLASSILDRSFVVTQRIIHFYEARSTTPECPFVPGQFVLKSYAWRDAVVQRSGRSASRPGEQGSIPDLRMRGVVLDDAAICRALSLHSGAAPHSPHFTRSSAHKTSMLRGLATRPRSRSEGAIRATVTRTPSASLLLRTRRSSYQTWYEIWPCMAGNAIRGATLYRIPAPMATLHKRLRNLVSCNIAFIVYNRNDWSRVESRDLGGWGKREIPEKPRQPAVSSDTIPTCENPGVTRPRIEPGSPWWASDRSTTAAPKRVVNELIAPMAVLILYLLRRKQNKKRSRSIAEFTKSAQLRSVNNPKFRLDKVKRGMDPPWELRVQGQEARERYGRH
ncbi:hypothetical protein PR048_026151 [Dryococelus australis]|uniref:Uncharacterized protein n=1 Tax=Dryococelus australis TaxID=614101 RepID=A0ABQ9GKJ7_9NEOP|nr:hypothetical protein PR048_026151 [Dryococelus australis]